MKFVSSWAQDLNDGKAVFSKKIVKSSGILTGCFISIYGFFRFFIEFFREPDNHIGLLYLDFSMGQFLCLPMILIGVIFIILGYKRTSFKS